MHACLQNPFLLNALLCGFILCSSPACHADDPTDSPHAIESRADASSQLPSLDELKRTGYERSRFSKWQPDVEDQNASEPPTADLRGFAERIRPLLNEYCADCHGPDLQEGNVQITALDPDLLSGSDTDWWTEVFSVVTKGEMPPADYMEMEEADRQVIVDWLSNELQAASLIRKSSHSRSSFRRLTRYEYNYSLQDLLDLPWEFAKDLPPEPRSEDGFKNRSDLLHLSVSQLETYHRLARQALERATVIGDRPQTRYWGIPIKAAADREWQKQAERMEKLAQKFADDPDQLQQERERLEVAFRQTHPRPYYQQLSSGRTAKAEWSYGGARYAFAPTDVRPEFPAEYDCVAILPAGQNQKLTIELGNQLPDEGTMRVTVRAARVPSEESALPSLQLWFGWQASNEGRALMRVSQADVTVTASPEKPQLIQWDIPLGELYPRNTVRKTSPMGALPSPSEYIRIANSAARSGAVQIDYVRVEAPVYEQWPPQSHRRIFLDSVHRQDDSLYAADIVQTFMRRAWGRPVSVSEVDRKMQLFEKLRPECNSFEQAIVEVLATVLSSPQFIFVNRPPHLVGDPQAQVQAASASHSPIDAYQLARRLSLFLWGSRIPDQELLELAQKNKLFDKQVLSSQVDRMLADPRSHRFTTNFVHQWLNLELLEFADFERHIKHFDPLLKEAMLDEPVALFDDMLQRNASVLDFLHADYAVLNERLAIHYGIEDVLGNEFRRVSLEEDIRRGGLLTQSGLLAMNSDFPDSHPLKRAIWLLECLLADPPPPPPPAVPQIDLADPEIAKMTLKERIEDHRDQPACRSCHMKIDPWGIAFENFDALGQWRDEIRGKQVDASSELFNRQTLDGIEGLKRFLLEHRQDQFIQAMVEKLTTYALGRSLDFEDRAEIETIAAEVRANGDGLKTMAHTIVMSHLFQSD